MRDLIAVIALVLFVGCSASQGPSSDGQIVVIPAWAREYTAEIHAEIAMAAVPEGWSVVITVPVFEASSSPTGLARGVCDYDLRRLTVGWRMRPYEDRPLLPALEHEVGHARYGPSYGH